MRFDGRLGTWQHDQGRGFLTPNQGGDGIAVLRHCPDTQMDGDRDGMPCEAQWCPDPRGR